MLHEALHGLATNHDERSKYGQYRRPYLEGYILLHDALQLIHLLAHASQSLLHLIDLHFAALSVALLGLLVLQLLPGGAISAAQRSCMHHVGSSEMVWLSVRTCITRHNVFTAEAQVISLFCSWCWGVQMVRLRLPACIVGQQ